MSEKRCYTVQELQEILGVSRSTIYNLLNADKHSPASSARSTKRRVRGDAYVSGSWKLPLTDREATAFMSK